MRETAKNYEERIENGDFKRYLHGKGIDIGGGHDCLKLPPDVKGSVRLWDLSDGDAQYMHKIPDGEFDFVYSSHCLEHMRDIRIAFTNWLRICKEGGIVYVCVPHETYYEKGIWPSVNNKDHKHSFTIDKKSTMPANVVINDFLKEFSEWIEIIDVRENLLNYHYDWDKKIDQSIKYEDMVCAQIDIIVRKKQMELSAEWRKDNNKNWRKDYWSFFLMIQIKEAIKRWMPKSMKVILKKIKRKCC